MKSSKSRNLPKERNNLTDQLSSQLHSTTTFIMFSVAVRASVCIFHSFACYFTDDRSAPHSLVSQEAQLPREPLLPQLLFDKVRSLIPIRSSEVYGEIQLVESCSDHTQWLGRKSTANTPQPISSKIFTSANSRHTKHQPSKPTTPKAMSRSFLLQRHQSLPKRPILRMS